MKEFKLSVETGTSTEQIIVTEDTTFAQIASQYGENPENPVMLVRFGGKLRELGKKVHKDGAVSFIRMSDKDGKRTYRRGVLILLQKAVRDLWGEAVSVNILYSLGQGIFGQFVGKSFEPSMLLELKKRMQELVNEDLPIEKSSMKTDEAEMLFQSMHMQEKERLLHYRRSSRVNIYELDGIKDYYYGYMVPSTGYLKYFDLEAYKDGFVVLFPNKKPTVIEPLETSEQLYYTLRESKKWSHMLGVGTIGALNDQISIGKGEEIILLSEALMEERIGALATQIAQDRSKKFIMIAGPSSSGKTSFANRLSMQMTARGLKPHAVGLDNYYADRELCPRDENGNLDFECLESLDVKQFHEDMTHLLEGKTVEMPTFDFKSGKREYRGRTLTLGPDDVLVIEGIHGLNDKLSCTLPSESKFKIYISALTQLNMDEHNLLSTTDCRLLRRIVRDARTRGTDARETIAMWPSVRRGEEKNIFPYQDSADAFFNSALVYEMAVIKVYAEPLLYQIGRECPEYTEAKRLLKLLDYFLPLPSEHIAHNSLLREFVGGSCFNV